MPPVQVQVTVVVVLPLTAAVNCWVAPGARVAEPGVTETETPVEARAPTLIAPKAFCTAAYSAPAAP